MIQLSFYNIHKIKEEDFVLLLLIIKSSLFSSAIKLQRC